MAHLYNYANQPWKTQRLIGRIFQEQYRNDPDGLYGNEDCGQMSAWLIMNAVGIYQVAPGKPLYSIGRPLFEEMTVNLPGGKSLRIVADNFSKGKHLRGIAHAQRKPDRHAIHHPRPVHRRRRTTLQDESGADSVGHPKRLRKSPADLVNPLVEDAVVVRAFHRKHVSGHRLATWA